METHINMMTKCTLIALPIGFPFIFYTLKYYNSVINFNLKGYLRIYKQLEVGFTIYASACFYTYCIYHLENVNLILPFFFEVRRKFNTYSIASE